MIRSALPARLAALIAIGAAFGVLASCSSDGSAPKRAASPPATRPDARVKVTVGLVNVATAGGVVQLAGTDRDAVVTAIGAYIKAATLDPLKAKATAPPAAALTALMAPSAAPALAGPDGDAFLDARLGPVTGTLRATLAPVNLTGLADKLGAVDLVGATLDLTVNANSIRGPFVIHRTGELMFTRDAGAWKILSFKLAVTREGAGLAAESTTTTGGTKP